MAQSDQCLRCRHYRLGRIAYEAFPESIPYAIINVLVNHSEPYPGDHDIRFEPNETGSNEDGRQRFASFALNAFQVLSPDMASIRSLRRLTNPAGSSSFPPSASSA